MERICTPEEAETALTYAAELITDFPHACSLVMVQPRSLTLSFDAPPESSYPMLKRTISAPDEITINVAYAFESSPSGAEFLRRFDVSGEEAGVRPATLQGVANFIITAGLPLSAIQCSKAQNLIFGTGRNAYEPEAHQRLEQLFETLPVRMAPQWLAAYSFLTTEGVDITFVPFNAG